MPDQLKALQKAERIGSASRPGLSALQGAKSISGRKNITPGMMVDDDDPMQQLAALQGAMGSVQSPDLMSAFRMKPPKSKFREIGAIPQSGGQIAGEGMTSAIARAFTKPSPLKTAILGGAESGYNRQDSALPAPAPEIPFGEERYPSMGKPEKVFGIDEALPEGPARSLPSVPELQSRTAPKAGKFDALARALTGLYRR